MKGLNKVYRGRFLVFVQGERMKLEMLRYFQTL